MAFGLGSLATRVQESAPECTTPKFHENEDIQSAGGCSIGANSSDRSKPGEVSAAKIQEAIKALAVGDVETARRLLM